MKFKSDIEVQAGLRDSSGSSGASGQILSSTASGVSWINQTSLSGYVPYTGATTNVDLGTHTLSSYNLIVNHTSGSGVAASITKGGSGEALTINKTSGSGNAMSVSGGLTSLVDLTLSSIANATIDTDKFIVSDSGAIKYRTGAQVLSDIGGQPALTNPITGIGTTDYVSKFTGTGTTLGDSQIFDNGTNVGIGTNIPSSTLQVGNGTGLKNILISGSGNNLGLGGLSVSFLGFATGTISTVFTSAAVALGVGTRVAQPLILGTNNAERMRIDSSGNVGIGTTSPASKLHVSDTSPVTTITSTATSGFAFANLTLSAHNGSSVTPGGAMFLTNSTASYAQISTNQLNIYGSAANGIRMTTAAAPIIFSTGNSDPDFSTERMRIASNGAIKFNSYGSGDFTGTVTQRLGVDSSGNVIEIPIGGGAVDGSGTTNYVTKWTDADTIGDSQIFDNGSGVGVNTSSPNYTTAGRGVLDINGSSQSMLALSVAGDGKGFLFHTGTDLLVSNEINGSIKLNTNGSEKAIITSTGNVGIGTTSPAYQLDVASSGRFSGLLISNDRLWLNGNTVISDWISSGLSSGYSQTNSYGWINGAGSLVLGTNGSERMRITSSGNVGIGTTTPTQLGTNITTLEIKGSSGGGVRSGVAGGSESTFYTIAAGGYLGTISNIPLNFQTNNSVKATILASGNVGIGTTSPTAKLHTYLADGVNDNSLRIQNGSNFYASIINLVANNDGGAIYNSISSNSNGGTEHFKIWGGASTSTMAMNTGGTERMRITSNGNVGIGTTAPSEKLDVYGVIRGVYTADPGSGAVTGKFLAYSPSAYGLVFRGYNTGAHSIQVQREANNAEIYPLSLQPNGGNVGIGTISPTKRLDVVSSTNDSFDAIVVRPNNQTQTLNIGWQGIATSLNFIVSTNGSEKMRVDTTGNVGINTTAPIHKLSVNGKIGGDVWSAGYIEFLSTTETVISAESNVVLGYAQNVVVDNEGSVGVGTIAPEACAAVEIKSITQGFLPPRMRTGERDGIGSPVAGLMIFNTDDEVIQVYTNGSGWRTLAFL
jgi:hypothetical protein